MLPTMETGAAKCCYIPVRHELVGALTHHLEFGLRFRVMLVLLTMRILSALGVVAQGPQGSVLAVPWERAVRAGWRSTPSSGDGTPL